MKIGWLPFGRMGFVVVGRDLMGCDNREGDDIVVRGEVQ